MFVCQFLIPCCLTVSIHSSTPETLTLDICLGNYEKYFVKSSGVQVCTVGKSWQKILCMLSVIIHSIFSSNVLDAILLYIIFTKVKYQTEKSKELIGRKAYDLRKRYVFMSFWCCLGKGEGDQKSPHLLSKKQQKGRKGSKISDLETTWFE